jgi:hypothetical protein
MPGSDIVGDFTRVGLSDLVVTGRVIDAFSRNEVQGFSPQPVEMVEEDRWDELSGPRVQLPYQGPALVDVGVTAWPPLDRGRSSVTLVSRCDFCGSERWHADGVEDWSSRWDNESARLVRRHTPRTPGMGIFVDESSLADASIFRVHEFPSWIFVTDWLKNLVESEEFTNISFDEIGESIE